MLAPDTRAPEARFPVNDPIVPNTALGTAKLPLLSSDRSSVPPGCPKTPKMLGVTPCVLVPLFVAMLALVNPPALAPYVNTPPVVGVFSVPIKAPLLVLKEYDPLVLSVPPKEEFPQLTLFGKVYA